MSTRSIAWGLLFSAVTAFAASASEEARPLTGGWSLNNWTPGYSVRLKLSYHRGGTHWEWAEDHALDELRGLTRDHLRAAHSSVVFTMDRDAGSFAFEGTLTLGIGRGEFRFTPSPTYTAKLAMLGYDAAGDDVSLMRMATGDVSLAFASEVKLSGLKSLAVSDLLRLKDHDVTLDFIHALAALGYAQQLTADDAVNLRDHGVDAGFVRALKLSGYGDMSASDIVRLRDHGVDGKFVLGLTDAGFSSLPAGDIVRLRDHGVDPDFVKELLRARPVLPSVDDVIKLREHGVDPEYVARIQSAGYEDLTVDQIIKLHDHGVD